MAEAFELIKTLGAGGFFTLAALVIYGGYKKIWVWGWQLEDSRRIIDEVKIERDQWKSAFLRTVQHTDKALDVGAVALSVAKPASEGGAGR